MKYDTNFKSVKDQVSAEEWQARVELAACYRLVDQAIAGREIDPGLPFLRRHLTFDRLEVG